MALLGAISGFVFINAGNIRTSGGHGAFYQMLQRVSRSVGNYPIYIKK
jgi:hypothetical protein